MNTKKLKSVEPVNEQEPVRIDKNQFPIVGIGASAGGLEALEEFFENMPVNNGMAFVVIQHLDPTHVGIMPELLQRITGMKVFQASDALKVKPNCVYVIPPNKSMSLLNGVLHLFDPVEARRGRGQGFGYAEQGQGRQGYPQTDFGHRQNEVQGYQRQFRRGGGSADCRHRAQHGN